MKQGRRSEGKLTLRKCSKLAIRSTKKDRTEKASEEDAEENETVIKKQQNAITSNSVRTIPLSNSTNTSEIILIQYYYKLNFFSAKGEESPENCDV